MKEQITRVLYFNSEKNIGGGEISLINLLMALLPSKYDISVICPPGELSQKLKEIGVKVCPVNIRLLKRIRFKFVKNRNYFFNPLAILYDAFLIMLNAYYLNRVTREIRPHLIHANTPEAMGLIVLPALLHKIPIIWHIRILPQEKSPTEKFYIRFLSKLAIKVIAVSKAVKERLIYLGVEPNKIPVVYNPVNTDVFRPQDKSICRTKLNLPLHTFIIGSIGRLYTGKGYEVFLKAATIVIQKYPNTHFLIAGRESERNYRKKIISQSHKLGLHRNFTLMDWQHDNRTLISSLDVLVLLSLKYEGFPRSLAEGMACEVTVIGSNVGGNTELIEDKKNGLVVPSGEVKLVADAICNLLENKHLAKQLARNGRKKVVENYSIHHHLQKIEKIYAEIQ